MASLVLGLAICLTGAVAQIPGNTLHHFYLDYPLQSLRFFKLPESNEVISFDFENKQYVIWKYTGLGNYYPVCQNDYYLAGQFVIDADSLICTDEKKATNAMIIGLNDGTDNGLKIEAYWNSDLRPITKVDLTFKCSNVQTGDSLKLFGGCSTIIMNGDLKQYYSNPLVRLVNDECSYDDWRSYTADTLDVSDLVFHNLEINISGCFIKIDMKTCESNGLLSYYPVYLLQNKPLNKLSIFTDLDFGACSGEYLMSNNDIYIVKPNIKIKLEEVIPGEEDGFPFFSILPEWSSDHRFNTNLKPTRKPRQSIR